jgi:erythromycin esterase-like protein
MIVDVVRRAAVPLSGSSGDYDALIASIGEARIVLLGEASHGSHEFYAERAAITRRLIEEKGFRAVAIEADWPDAARVHRYVQGRSADASAAEALGDFSRFPRWMWRNAPMRDFVHWLRGHNDRQAADSRTGVYGLDLYSLHDSIAAVLRYLDAVDPAAARAARSRYACFDHYGEDTQAYGHAAAFGLSRSCEDAVVRQLGELRRGAAEYLGRDGVVADEEFFFAEQNARLVADAEAYYRAMFEGRVSS